MIKQENLAGTWAPATEVLDRLAKMRAAREQHRTLLSGLQDRLHQRRDELENSLGDLTNAERLSVTSRAAASFKRELLKSSAPSRSQLQREAVQHAEKMRGVTSHYRSPMQMLMRESLGSERRSRILQQIDNSGPTELASLAAYAAATKDADLAAALCSRNSAMRATQRPFSSSALAEALFGDQFRRVSAALNEVQILAQEMLNEDRAFAKGRADPMAKMTTVLARRAIPSDPSEQ